MYLNHLLGAVALLPSVIFSAAFAIPKNNKASNSTSSGDSEDVYVNNNGTTIHYSKYGSGPPLIFLHGFPDNSKTWNLFQVPYFQDSYTVITPDMRGYPPSDVPLDQSEYGIDTIATDILAILDNEGLDNATLVSHDWGSTPAWTFALTYTNRTRALITMNGDSPTFADLLTTDPEQQLISRYALPFEAWQPGQPKNISSLVENYRNASYAAEIAAYLDASPIDGMMNWYKEDYPRAPFEGPNPWVYHTVPALILWGEGDPYFSSKTINDLVRHYQLGVRVVTIPDAGHWVFHDQHDRVNRELQSFLDFWEI